MNDVFRLDQVSKFYQGKTALSELSLSLARARTTVLVGPSGCGKSTVFGLLTGLIRPDAGAVFFENELITTQTITTIRRRIGYVIQDGGLFPHLTGRGNVSLLPRYLGWPSAKIVERVRILSELTRLPADLLGRFPEEMSGGQKQRVSLMRGLMLDPEVLLLDEPFGALDPMVRSELQDDLAIVFKQLGKTVVLVTHDLNEAVFFADEIILMRDGGIVQTGAPEDLIRNPVDEFAQRFVNAQRIKLPRGRQV